MKCKKVLMFVHIKVRLVIILGLGMRKVRGVVLQPLMRLLLKRLWPSRLTESVQRRIVFVTVVPDVACEKQ